MICGDVYRRRQKATLISDLPHFYTGDAAEVQDQKARLAAIQKAEAVTALLYWLKGPCISVHHHDVAEEFGIPNRRNLGNRDERSDKPVEELAGVRIEQGTVQVERAILNRNGNLVVHLVRWKLVVLFGGRAW